MLYIIKPLYHRKVVLKHLEEIQLTCPAVYKAILNAYRSFNTSDDEVPSHEVLLKDIVYLQGNDPRFLKYHQIYYSSI
jgi:hypothetical protein